MRSTAEGAPCAASLGLRSTNVGAPSQCGSGIFAATVCGARGERREAGDEGWCALRARPIPRAGCGLQVTVYGHPPPAHSRNVGAETGDGGREARVGAPFGRGRSRRGGRKEAGDEGWSALRARPFDLSRHPSPVRSTNVGAASCRDSSARSGLEASPTGPGSGCRLQSTVACTPSPVTRHPSPVTRHPSPVSRNPSPVHSVDRGL